MPKKIELPVTDAELKREYESGLNTYQLGQKYGCHNCLISKRLKSAKCEMRSNKLELPVTDDELKREYESGLNSDELAKKYGCSQSVILRCLKSANCELRDSKITQRKKLPITDFQLKEEYESGVTTQDLAGKYGGTSQLILKRLRSVGCKIRGSTATVVLSVTDSQLKEEYKSGLTTQDLAGKYGCGNTTMHRRLVNVGCKMRTNNEHKKGCEPANKIYLPITDIELKRDYESGLSVYQLADMYGCMVNVIIKHLKSVGTEMRAGRANRKSIAATNDELKEEYESGVNSIDLAKKYGCAAITLLRRLNSMGCEIRDKRTCQEIITLPITDDKLKEEYESGLTKTELAEKYGCCSTTILKHLKLAGCEMRVIKGENHPFWDGGISFEPYCPKFNESFKESIRNKFDRKCFICGITEKEMQEDQRRRGTQVYKLPIHHVNYNKDCLCDDSECEFVPLCLSHHAKTNYNREYWESVILQKINALKMYDSNDIGGQRTVFEFIA